MDRAGFDATCRALPAVTMVVQWGESQVYKVGGKAFAWLTPRDAVSLKCSEIAYMALTESGVGHKAPYTSGGFWIGFDSLDAVSDDDLAGLIAQSHALIAAKLTRKVRADLGLA